MGIMLIFVLLTAICITASIMDNKDIWQELPKETKRYRFYKKFIYCWGCSYSLFAILFGAFLIGFGIAIAINNSPTTRNILNSELAIKREYIVSQLENGVYRTVDDEDPYFSFDRDSSYGMKETMKEAMEFDSVLEAKRIKCNSFWTGIFNTPVDDSIQPINAVQYIDGSVKYGVDGDFKFVENDTWVPNLL